MRNATSHLARSLHGAIGQPCFKTHQHLIPTAQHLTPTIQKNEFALRRQRLASALPHDSLLLVPAYRMRYSSRNIFYPFQQNNSLLYLTGLIESDAALVLSSDGQSTLFVSENDPEYMLWNGSRCGVVLAKDHFGVDAAFDLKSIKDWANKEKRTIYRFPSDGVNECEFGITSAKIISTRILDNLRVIKSIGEQLALEKSAKIASEAFKDTISRSKFFKYESQIAAHLEYDCRMRGADQGLAYVPVVAGSDRATILHYTHNDRCLDENNLILVDAGAKAFGYCSDISRTWPHKSKFSHEQKQLYEAVLRVQQTCIERVQRHQKNPVSFLDLNILASELIFKEIVNLGFPATRETVETVFPHSIGHHLGLDLHDCATIEINRPLTKDMCITIEPGIYVPCSPSFPECFHGMGIRIEDDLLLTHDGVSVLTSSVPKSIDDLEAL